MAKKLLIIGGGFAGCCAAHMLKEKGFETFIVESGKILGGGVRTYWYGGHPYTFGPRHFLTENKKWFDYLNKIIPMRDISKDHQNLTYVEEDQKFWSYPPNMDDINKMSEKDKILNELKNLDPPMTDDRFNFEEVWKSSITPTLYRKFAEKYSKKMWQVESNRELDGEEFKPIKVSHDGDVISTCKVKIRDNKAVWGDSRVISAFPLAANGYNDYFEISTKNTNVFLNTKVNKFDLTKNRVKLSNSNDWFYYDILISTISPEHLFDQIYGELRWMGRDFFKIVLPVKEVFPKNIYFQYYANNEPFTRIVEYKKFYQYDSDQTLLGIEIPSKKNKLYPFPTKKDQELANKYLNELPNNVFSIGRAGSYKYIDMDDIVGQGFDLKEKI